RATKTGPWVAGSNEKPHVRVVASAYVEAQREHPLVRNASSCLRTVSTHTQNRMNKRPAGTGHNSRLSRLPSQSCTSDKRPAREPSQSCASARCGCGETLLPFCF